MCLVIRYPLDSPRGISPILEAGVGEVGRYQPLTLISKNFKKNFKKKL
jgi:hypothetical protein